MNIKAQNKKFLKLLFVVKKVAEALSRRIKHNRRGRSRKFNLFQIIACLVYKVKKGIKSFRELEYRINQDIINKLPNPGTKYFNVKFTYDISNMMDYTYGGVKTYTISLPYICK